MRVFILALICTCFSGSLGGDVFLNTRHKRATCPPEFEKITTTHSACKDPSTQAIPNPFSPEEAAVIIQQHIDYRAQENASAMMRPVWDDDIAYVAQKWADVCGEQGAHDGSLERLVPSLMGIYIGQNVATFSGGFSTYEIATDLWHGEIQNFEYGTGAVPSNAVIGHYTQVVLADVSKIGCGRTTCGGSTKVVCNYAKGQMTADLVTPFAQCEDPSCKFNCQTRDENQLCDCGGLMCLHQGTLDKTTCTCSCKPGFSGPSCETADCANIAADRSYCDPNFCWYQSAICTSLCGVCDTACDSVTCENGGTMNTFICKCTCPEGFTGDTCSIQETTTPATSTTPQTSTGTSTIFYTTYSTTPIPSTTPQTSTGTGTMYYTTYSTTPIPSTTPQTSTGTGTMYYTTYSTTPIPSTTPQTSTGTGTMYYTTYSTTPIPSTTPQTSTGTGIMYYTTYSTTPIPSTTPQTSTGTGTMYYTTYSTTPIPSTTPQTSTGTGTMYYTTYSTSSTPSTTPQTSTQTTPISTTEATTSTTTSTTTTTTTTTPSTTAVSSCTTPPEIPNSDVTVADGVATYKCQEGTLPSGGSRSGDTSTCTDGVWSPTTLQCRDVSSCYKKSGRYAVYSGTQSTTNKGHTCQAWSSQSPIAHSKGAKDVHFATVSGYTENPSVAAQSNYCRDPYGFGKPFCFTMTPGVRIDYCNEVIPDCNTITTTATPTSTQTTTATSTTESTTPTTTSTTTTTTTMPSTTAVSSCTTAPEIPNSEVTVADGVATYKCQEGTLPFGGTSSGDTSTCTEGVWTPTTLQCRDVSTCYQKSGRFAVYSGTQTTTNGGHTCQAWSSQSPVAHSQGTKDVHFATVSGYTENPTVAAQSNYCRDPSGYGKPFCFTMTPGKRIDYCDQVIPKCDCPEHPIVANSNVSRVDNKATYSCKEGFAATSATSSVSTCLNGLWSPVNIKCHDVSQCYIISGGSRIYTGTHSTTLSGHTCQAWAEQTPLAHSYEAKHFIRLAGPDTTLADHGNYCRDPSGYGRRSRGYLWCFTTDPSKRLEKCSDVPQCPL